MSETEALTVEGNRMREGFTPGPWLRAASLVYALDENERVNRFSAQLSGGFTLVNYRNEGPRTSPEEVEANARLIAASPDGYDFAAEFIAFIERSDLDDLDFGRGLASSGLIEQARAYLAKVRGAEA